MDVLATVQEAAFIQIPGVVSGKAVCCLANKEIVDDRPSVVRGSTQSVVVSSSLCKLRCPTSFREGDLSATRVCACARLHGVVAARVRAKKMAHSAKWKGRWG